MIRSAPFILFVFPALVNAQTANVQVSKAEAPWTLLAFQATELGSNDPDPFCQQFATSFYEDVVNGKVASVPQRESLELDCEKINVVAKAAITTSGHNQVLVEVRCTHRTESAKVFLLKVSQCKKQLSQTLDPQVFDLLQCDLILDSLSKNGLQGGMLPTQFQPGTQIVCSN